MTPDLLKQLSELTASRDRIEFSLGDTYDIKMSIVLLVATFLATLSGTILGMRDLPIPIRWLQFFGIISLVVSAAYCFVGLWPRDYRLEADPRTIQERVELKANAGEWDIEKVLRLQMEKAQERITINRRFNSSKSHLVDWAFRWVFAAFALEIVSLICLLPIL